MAAEHPSQDSTGKVPLWRQPTFRAIVFQVLLVLCLLAFGNFLLSNTLQNMEQRGITTGFGFLDNAAGFGILRLEPTRLRVMPGSLMLRGEGRLHTWTA